MEISMSDEQKPADRDTRRFKSTEEAAFANIGGTLGGEGLPFDTVGERGQHIYGGVTGQERLRRLRDIDRTMLDVIADSRRANPMRANTSQGAAIGELSSGGSATPMGAGRVAGEPRGTGWREGAPLHSSTNNTTNAYIDALAHAAFPHSPGHPDYKGRGPKPKE
jgi:hypothetical protein